MITTQIVDRGIRDAAVLDAMRSVSREKFVSAALAPHAYEDRPLPIEAGQTLSQPFMVALMAQELRLAKDHRVLEVGAGSGYAAAVLSRIATEIYAVEIDAQLAELAKSRLAALGYANVHVRHADGSEGWTEHAPYDGILVSAAAPEVPKPLPAQLAPGGRLVIPVGASARHQVLWRITRLANDAYRREALCDVAFVPLVGSVRRTHVAREAAAQTPDAASRGKKR